MKVFVLSCVILFAGITVMPRGYANLNFKLPTLVSSAASEQAEGLVTKRGVIRKLLLAGTLALGITAATCGGLGCQQSQDTVTDADVVEQTELTNEFINLDKTHPLVGAEYSSVGDEYSSFAQIIDATVKKQATVVEPEGEILLDDDAGAQSLPANYFSLPVLEASPIPPPGYIFRRLDSHPPAYQFVSVETSDLSKYYHPVPPPGHIYYITTDMWLYDSSQYFLFRLPPGITYQAKHFPKGFYDFKPPVPPGFGVTPKLLLNWRYDTGSIGAQYSDYDVVVDDIITRFKPIIVP